MAVEIKVPSVGESITEGTIARWLKKDGDAVQADEAVFELETEKATTEVPSPAAGTLKIVTPAGATVAIGAIVARVEEATPAESKKQEPPSTPPKGPRVDGRAPAREAALSPAARRLVDENRVDVAALHGTGRGGRITKEDVQSHLQAQAPKAPPQPVSSVTPEPAPKVVEPKPAPKPANRETRQRISSIRQRIAARLLQSEQTTARLTTFNESDMSAIMALRERYKERFKEKHGVSLGFMSFFVKACVEALQAYPVVNARLDGDDIVTPANCHIGVAVSTERGLMVPVVHDADQLGFAAIEKAIADLAAKARDGKITVNDLQGGTFTITNGGVFGSLLSTPILNPPQSAILGMHAIQKRPVAVNDQVVIRPMMYLALSYDHRLIDGREAVLFLVRVKECLENPERMLLQV